MSRPSDASWVIPAAGVALFALVVGCELIPTAAAQTVAYNAARVHWDNATTATDGAALPIAPPDVPDALARTEIYRSVCNADGTAGATVETLSVVVPAGPLSVLFENLPDNTTQCFRARHFTFGGKSSNLTAAVSKAITPLVLPKKPRPPRNPRAE
jgi:hypothetical protein